MSAYLIKESDGTVINPAAVGELDFFKKIYPDKVIEKVEPLTLSSKELAEQEQQEARSWRNAELDRTDTLYLVEDYPDKDKLKTYRQELRDWPSTADFPDKKPTLGS